MTPAETIKKQVCETLIKASSSFGRSKADRYRLAIDKESNPQAKWAMEAMLENAIIAEKNRSPLCDDTGIPHLILELGKNMSISGELLDAVNDGVAEGLRQLPGRPMAIRGDDVRRIDQSDGLYENPDALLPAPMLIKRTDADVARLTVLMLGGGPAIRGKTYRVYHKHNMQTVIDEIIKWGLEGVRELGCSPCTLCVGIGRSQFEASSLMLEAMACGSYDVQSELERTITDGVNAGQTGALGLGGDTAVLGTFLKIGEQRASGVRIVSFRPCCCFEPRVASIELDVGRNYK